MMVCAKYKIVWLLLVLLSASCALTRSRPEPLPYTKPPEEAKLDFEILDHHNMANGAVLAEWASLYMNGGIPALEKTDEFAPYYVFVAEQTSRALNPLLLWRDNFNVEQDFPQLVFSRAYRRLTNDMSINPDETYGAFFETLMKRITSLRWPQARQYADTWLLVRYSLAGPAVPQPAAPEPSVPLPFLDEPAEISDDSEVYIYLILTVIEKADVENVLQALVDETSAALPLQRDKVQAINAIKSNLFPSF
jgi:hypothetical protein